MAVAGTDDQLLATLAVDRNDATAGRSLSELMDALGLSNGRLSGQIEFASTLESLREDGLVERDASAEDEGTDVAFVLTEAGEDRAVAVRERLADTEIEVVDGDRRRELTLSAAADTFGRPVAEIAADVTPDGVYYREDAPTVDRIVGRRAQRDRFETVLEEVRERARGAAVFVTGPGGVGKTTLAERFLEDAREKDGVSVARARCQGSGEPYQPLRELLAALEGDVGPFSDVGAVAEEPEAFRAQQNALFYDVTTHLAPSSDEAYRVLYLDDLHHAGAGTMAYLAYLLEGVADRRLVILGSYRPAELADDAPIAAENVTTDGPITHFRLGPLDREGTRGVIERVVERRGAPEALVDAIRERTGGNPLFVEETVARLLETDQLDPGYEWYPEDADAVDVPEAVKETIERRVDALDEDARSLLRWAALIGEHVHLEVLRSVHDLAPARFETLVDALVGADVFDRSTDGEAVAFRSEVVREALHEDLAPSDRRERHDAIAAALEDVDRGADPEPRDGGADLEVEVDTTTGDRAAAIAAHHERARNEDRAIAWYRRAGERATAVYAHDTAIEHYHGALALAKDGHDEETLLDVSERIAEIYLTVGEPERTRRHLEFVRERTDDPHRRQRVYRKLGLQFVRDAEFERALSIVEDGLALAEDPGADDEETCRLLRTKGLALLRLDRYDEAIAAGERVAELAAENDDDALRATAVLLIGRAWLDKGELERAEPILREAVERTRDAGLSEKLAQGYSCLGILATRRNDHDTALSRSKRARDIYEEIGEVYDVATTTINIGVIYSQVGDTESALEQYRQARETARRIGETYLLAFVEGNVASIDLDRGDVESCLDTVETVKGNAERVDARVPLAYAEYLRARCYYYRASSDRMATAVDRLHETAQEADAKRWLIRAIGCRGMHARLEGDVEAAAEHLREATDLASRYGQDEEVLENRLELVLTCAARDDAAGALEQVDALESLATEYDAETVALARGVAARLDGRYGEAADALETALAESREKDNRITAFRALEQQARLALARDDDERAREVATDLEARAAERGLELFADRAREILATRQ